MLSMSKGAALQTVITTFETSPAHCEDLLEELRAAYSEVISRQPGFLGAGLHVNDARTRVANYSQWARREDFQAMLRSDEMRARNMRLGELCRSFEPVLYDLAEVYGD